MFNKDMGPMKRTTSQEAVADNLRRSIIEGRLAPGDKMNYAELAGSMGVSMTPVREAMKVLNAQGLVTIRSYRTACVSTLTVEEIQQIYELRKILEGIAARQAVQRISPQQVSQLRQIVSDIDEVIRRLIASKEDSDTVASNLLKLLDLHDKFHLLINEMSGNNYLCRIIDFLRGHLGPYFASIAISISGRLELAQAEHYGILKAFEKGDPEQAERLIQEHLGNTAEMLVNYIGNQAHKSNISLEGADKVDVK
jgi:DNA-binding GntR family transcriptional regulator